MLVNMFGNRINFASYEVRVNINRIFLPKHDKNNALLIDDIRQFNSCVVLSIIQLIEQCWANDRRKINI